MPVRDQAPHQERMRSAAGRLATLVGVRPPRLRGSRHGDPSAWRWIPGEPAWRPTAAGSARAEPMTGAAMFWIVLSIAGLVVETTLIIVLGCRITERDEPAGNSAARPGTAARARLIAARRTRPGRAREPSRWGDDPGRRRTARVLPAGCSAPGRCGMDSLRARAWWARASIGAGRARGGRAAGVRRPARRLAGAADRRGRRRRGGRRILVPAATGCAALARAGPGGRRPGGAARRVRRGTAALGGRGGRRAAGGRRAGRAHGAASGSLRVGVAGRRRPRRPSARS